MAKVNAQLSKAWWWMVVMMMMMMMDDAHIVWRKQATLIIIYVRQETGTALSCR